jgi:hypothetical protein
MFLVILLAIVAVFAALSWLLVRGRGGRADWFPNRPDSSLSQIGDGQTHHSGPSDYGGHLGDGHVGGGHMGGGHGL